MWLYSMAASSRVSDILNRHSAGFRPWSLRSGEGSAVFPFDFTESNTDLGSDDIAGYRAVRQPI